MSSEYIYRELAGITARGEEAAVVTIISTSGSTPRRVGAKMLVRADGSILGTIGGGSLEAQVIGKAIKAMKHSKPQQLHFSLDTGADEVTGMVCGGDMDVFIEPILSSPTLFIFGGGHISLPLAKFGRLLGFKIAVIDDRVEYANPERFPEVELILDESFETAFARLEINKSSYLVIITRNHQYDELVLELALGTDAKYIGMIGSKTKNKAIFGHLLAKGIPQELLDRVRAPIGLKISAQTPEEIAVSIMAEVVMVRRSSA